MLNLLEAAGAVLLGSRIEPAAGAPSPVAAAQAAQQFAIRYRSVERSRVEMMRRYAELTDCRRRFLLRYFGEAVADPCGRCDNCDAGLSTAHPAAEHPAAEHPAAEHPAAEHPAAEHPAAD